MPRIASTHCKDCNIELDITNTVWVTAISKSGRCRTCHNKYYLAQKREREANNPELLIRKNISLRKRHLKKRYGITVEEFNRKLEIQFNCCTICKQSFTTSKETHVDHNHDTNKIRDILCDRCNRALGLVNEDIEILLNMIEYLRKYNGIVKSNKQEIG